MPLDMSPPPSTINDTNSYNADKENENACCETPKKLRHKRLDMLIPSEGPFLKIPASPAMQKLGYGTGVHVYLMERSPKPSGELRSPWAIKKLLKLRKNDGIYGMRLEYEARILKELSHPNIIGFRGFGNPATASAYLAMEKASKSLGDLIEERVEELTPMGAVPFPANLMEKVANDVAKALEYLHDEKKYIHGDLKGSNILVFGDFETIKLCDFGVARKLQDDGTIDGRYVGTEIWNPLEVILLNKGFKNQRITQKADIYPYGLVLHEMMSLKPPHFSTAEDEYEATNTDTESSMDEFDEEAFDAALQRRLGKRPTLPDYDFDDSYNRILGVFFCCTEENHEKRPSAKEILTMLQTKE